MVPSETSELAAAEDGKLATNASQSMVNKGDFRIGPRHAVTAILPSSQLDWCISELRDAGFSKGAIQVLRGEEGREIFDIKGTHHGVRGRVIRAIQVAGSIHNEMLNYDSALRKGFVVIVVQVADEEQISSVAHIFVAHEGDRVMAYGRKGSQTEWL